MVIYYQPIETGPYWSECPLCGPMVICGKCGNNCCNGGYGTLADGSQCDACPEAYAKQDREYRERVSQ